nr:hypothetical protein [Nitratireductor soli]
MGLFVRTIGIARARTKIGTANLAYNLTRFVGHQGRTAARMTVKSAKILVATPKSASSINRTDQIRTDRCASGRAKPHRGTAGAENASSSSPVDHIGARLRDQ